MAESGTVTEAFVPLNESALLNLPVVTQVAFAERADVPVAGLVGGRRPARLVEAQARDEPGEPVFETVTATFVARSSCCRRRRGRPR